MKKPALRRGDQVLVNPHISGPAAGRLGFASGSIVDGHYEILDQAPDQSGAAIIGYFEPEDLYVPAVRRRRRP